MITYKKTFPSFLLGTLFTVGGTVHAAQSVPRLEEVTVIASRIAMPIRQVGASVSVMTEKELALKNYTALSDALRTLPSVQVSQNGGLGSSTTVRVRGEEGHRTQLLIDGINVADPSATQIVPRFGQILNSQWGRVEVLRGPQGMMYGADAGGVISVFSKQSDAPIAGDVTVEGGRYDTRRISGNLRGQREAFRYSLTVADVDTEGFNARESDDSGERDGYDNTTVHLNTGADVTEHTGVELVLRDVDAQSAFDGCYLNASSNRCVSDFGQRSGRLQWHYEDTVQRHQIAYNETRTDRVNTVVDQGGQSLDSEGTLKQWQYLGHYDVADDLSFVYGADHREDSYTDHLDSEDFERDQIGVFAEGQVAIGDAFYYTVGARYDDNDDFGEHVGYRLTGAYLVPVGMGEVKVRGSYGTGFRAPSLYEIAYNHSPFAGDVPQQLQEETSRGYELGVEWILGDDTFVELVGFDNTIEDEIFFDLSSFAGYLQADGETESRGVEFNASVAVADAVILAGNYTYNDTALSDDTTLSGAQPGDPRPRRPEHSYNLSVRYTTRAEHVTLALFYRGARDAVDYPYGASEPAMLDDYDVLSFNGIWRVTQSLDVYVRGENLTDEQYQEVDDYNTAGRAAYLGARFHF